jgi:hypothetical protein
LKYASRAFDDHVTSWTAAGFGGSGAASADRGLPQPLATNTTEALHISASAAESALQRPERDDADARCATARKRAIDMYFSSAASRAVREKDAKARPRLSALQARLWA